MSTQLIRLFRAWETRLPPLPHHPLLLRVCVLCREGTK